MKTESEGALMIIQPDGEVYGFVRKDPNSHHNVFYKCMEMSMDEISSMFKTESNV